MPVLPDVVSASTVAVWLGVTAKTVRELARRRIVVRTNRDAYVLNESVEGYCSHLRELATGRGGKPAMTSATVERARLTRIQADLAETKGRKLKGELVKASEVEAEWSGVLRTVRAGMLAVPNRCQHRLLHPAHDVTEIDAEVREALTEIGTVSG